MAPKLCCAAIYPSNFAGSTWREGAWPAGASPAEASPDSTPPPTSGASGGRLPAAAASSTRGRAALQQRPLWRLQPPLQRHGLPSVSPTGPPVSAKLPRSRAYNCAYDTSVRSESAASGALFCTELMPFSMAESDEYISL